jgi:hypothetical protein
MASSSLGNQAHFKKLLLYQSFIEEALNVSKLIMNALNDSKDSNKLSKFPSNAFDLPKNKFLEKCFINQNFPSTSSHSNFLISQLTLQSFFPRISPPTHHHSQLNKSKAQSCFSYAFFLPNVQLCPTTMPKTEGLMEVY